MNFRKILTQTILVFGFLFFFLILPKLASAATYVDGPINSDTTWFLSKSPYVIIEQVTINPGVTLSLEPGVIVKLKRGARLVIRGIFYADATASQKIYFTSYKDDSIGGDTNGDGDQTQPEVGDWLHIRFDSNSFGKFDYTVVRYAGAMPDLWTGVHSNGGEITISHSQLYLNNEAGIFQDGGSSIISDSEIYGHALGVVNFSGEMTVINSSIYDNAYFGLMNEGTEILMAENNWWGDASGPYHPILNPSGLGDEVSDNVDFIPWLISDPMQESQNQPPEILDFYQFKSDKITEILEGEITTENIVVFKAMLFDLDEDQVKLQIEIKKFDQVFNETDLLESDFIASGSEVTLMKNNFLDDEYHWRARAVDNQGDFSDWQEFGESANIDFKINTTLSYKAANLAKQLVNHPEAYLWGGKGWDYDLAEFVSPTSILSGYTYYNPDLPGEDTGVGVDCSGLVTWAFNRSFNHLLSTTKNFVKYVNANGLYSDNQSDHIEETELLPGDALFFDWDNDEKVYIDHVAMYVGESGGYDVVNARNVLSGIVAEKKDEYKNIEGFEGFGRIHEGVIKMKIGASSPINLSVTDPDGFIINPDSIIQSNEEYIREITGELYYLELEQGHDGRPVDQVYSPVLKMGDYTIKVLPAVGASPSEMYTLTFQTEDQTIILAENVPLSQIPAGGYGITISENGEINTFIPVLIDIKPGDYPNVINLKSKGNTPLGILGSSTFDVQQINPYTIKLASAGVKIKGNGQPMVSYSDINNDGFNDIIVHVITQQFQLTQDDTEVKLEAKLINADTISGIDSILIVPNKK